MTPDVPAARLWIKKRSYTYLTRKARRGTINGYNAEAIISAGYNNYDSLNQNNRWDAIPERKNK